MPSYGYEHHVQLFTITNSGNYVLIAEGGTGGASILQPGGAGAEVSGTFALTAGDILEIQVGDVGSSLGPPNNNSEGGGGGGGSFIYDITTGILLEVAGGGGGGGTTPGGDGNATTDGSSATGIDSGSGGTGGNGGGGGTYLVNIPFGPAGYNAGGGGGILSGGAAGSTGNRNPGYNGGDVGILLPTIPFDFYDSYGGLTGGGGGVYAGGGGAGYSGGGGGYGVHNGLVPDHGAGGGGGGSFVDAAAFNAVETAGVNTSGDGSVSIEATCFTEGTLIRTQAGDVAVETLKIGDMLTTNGGVQATIKFIGKRSYDGKFIAGQHLALPITFHKNSIAENTPKRDLTVSPGHGMFIDGVIVPAWRLVNGKSIKQAEAVERVDYFHIELAEGHGILLAENCPAESYLDIGTRNQFQNAAEFYAKYPVHDISSASCNPRIESGFQLEAIRNRIAARAGIAAPTRQTGELRGFVDQSDDNAGNGEFVVSGWAQNPTQPEVPVILCIEVDHQPVMSVLANQYRADLRAAGLGSGCHGFELTLLLSTKGRVVVRQAGSGAILPLTNAAATRAVSSRQLPTACRMC